MIADDPFSARYAALLDDTYDLVDRIVLNGYFNLAQSPGGFRTWWRQLRGDDDQLDNTHLMRLAGRFSRRVRGWAAKHNIAVVDCPAGQRKHEIAARLTPTDPAFCGIFAVLVGKAPAPIWDVQRYGRGGINLRRKKPMPYVNHYHFHIMDRDWGHVTIKICGHPPFNAQIMLNGHEYVARQLQKRQTPFVKEGNCFTDVSNAADLATVADTLSRSRGAAGRLRQVCERWIYRCVCFGVSFDEQARTNFRYRYSVYQAEYSRNLLFARRHQRDQVFQGMIERVRGPLNLKTIKTIFGCARRPWRRDKNGQPFVIKAALERPVYDLTVFKLHFGRLTLKVYTKGQCVLRIEAIVHNSEELRCGKVIDKFNTIIERLAQLLDRFMAVLRSVDGPWIADQTLEQLPAASVVGKTRVGGVNLNQARMRAAMQAVTALAASPRGFTSAEHAQQVQAILGAAGITYSPRHAAYDLKKLRGKGLVEKTDQRSRRYRAPAEGVRMMTALIVLRDRIIKPLLAAANSPARPHRPQRRQSIDDHYRAIQYDMRGLFKALNFAA